MHSISLNSKITLNNGIEMPIFGLGRTFPVHKHIF